MEVTKGKIGAAVLGVAGLGAALYFGLRQVSSDGPAVQLSDRQFDVQFLVQGSDEGGQVNPIVALNGTLSLAKAGDKEYQGQWLAFQKLDLGGAAQANHELLGKSFGLKFVNDRMQLLTLDDLSTASSELNLGVLDKLIPPFVPSELSETRMLVHTADWGPAQVEFSAQGSKVVRAFKRSVKNDFFFDPSRSTIEYTFDDKGELQDVKGELVAKRLDNGQMLRVEIGMKSNGKSSEKPIAKLASSKLTAYDSKKAARAARGSGAMGTDTLGLMSFDEVVERLNGATLEELSADYGPIMQSLIFELYDNPALASKIAEIAAKASDGTEEGQKKVTLLMASIASSDDASASNVLADLAKTQCPDTYCKDQALMAYAMHQVPTVESAKTVLEIAQTATDPEISGTAYLASGAAGGVLTTEFKELVPALTSALEAKNGDDTLHRNVILAMGNHGDVTYLPSLVNELKSEEAWDRGAAVKAMRFINSPEVNGTIVRVFESDKDSTVQLDALTAMSTRSLDRDEYARVASHSLATGRDVQESSASVLVDAGLFLGADTTEALNKLGSGTKHPEVKAIVDEGLARIAKFKETGSWSEDYQESDFDNSGGEDAPASEENSDEEAPAEESAE